MTKFNRALLGGSLILLITFNLYNLINFVFQFAMARMLTPADYGLLATLFSFIYLSGIFSEPMMTILAKYSAGESEEKIKNLLKRSLRKAFKIASSIFLVFIFLAIPLSVLLNIPYLLLSSTGLIIFAAFFLPITRGILQGKKRFQSLGVNLVIEALIKLSLAIIFVLIGWKVYGAMTAAILASFLAFFFSFLALRDIFKSREKQMEMPGFYSYSWPAFFMLFSILLFFSLDVIIARIVFDATTAGYYAIASTLAKIIFLATLPISKALFPISAERKEDDNDSLLGSTLILILALISLALVAFYFFPDFIIKIFAGRMIIESGNILIYLAIAMSILSITNLLLLFKLSRGKTKNYWIFIVFPIIEAVLLSVFSHNLIEFSLALIVASAIFLWGIIFFLEE